MTCSVDGCDTRALKRGYCGRHYLRWWRHGDPLGGGADRGPAQEFFQNALLFQGAECLTWPFAVNEQGYAIMNSKGRSTIVSRRVCESVHGAAPEEDMQAAHSCGRGHEACINPKHLRWATYLENRQDMVTHGRSLRGEKNPSCSLSAGQVAEIRHMLGRSSQRAIAAQYGVTQSTITSIATGRTWSWLEA